MYKLGIDELSGIQDSLIDLVESLTLLLTDKNANDYDAEIKEANKWIIHIDKNYLNIEH